MAQWVIFYCDGSTHSDEDGGPELAPAVGVFSILQRMPRCATHDRKVYEWQKREGGLHGEDWYWFRPDEGMWYCGDLNGLLDAVMYLGAMYAKAGRTVSHADYDRLIAQVGKATEDFL